MQERPAVDDCDSNDSSAMQAKLRGSAGTWQKKKGRRETACALAVRKSRRAAGRGQRRDEWAGERLRAKTKARLPFVQRAPCVQPSQGDTTKALRCCLLIPLGRLRRPPRRPPRRPLLLHRATAHLRLLTVQYTSSCMAVLNHLLAPAHAIPGPGGSGSTCARPTPRPRSASAASTGRFAPGAASCTSTTRPRPTARRTLQQTWPRRRRARK